MTNNASVICIGNELLSGETIDTNKAFLGRELTLLGIPLTAAYTIPDDVDIIADTIKLAAIQSDLILITGGLGPTDDDVTRQGLAKFLGVDMQLHPDLLEVIKGFFAARGSVMAEMNKSQAYLPIGVSAIKNPHGTAPGMLARYTNPQTPTTSTTPISPTSTIPISDSEPQISTSPDVPISDSEPQMPTNPDILSSNSEPPMPINCSANNISPSTQLDSAPNIPTGHYRSSTSSGLSSPKTPIDHNKSHPPSATTPQPKSGDMPCPQSSDAPQPASLDTPNIPTRHYGSSISSEGNEKIIACMPGVPSEMKNMFFDSVRGVFSTFGKQQAIVVRKLKCTGAGESAIAQMLGDEMARGKNPLVNCTCHGCVITLHIVAAAEDPDSASAMADEKVEQLSRLLASINVPSGAKSSGPQGAIEAESSGSQGAIEAKSFGPQGAVEARKIPAPLIFGFDDDTLEGVVGKELTKLSKTVALAESCTGGLIAKMLTDAPGATKFFKYGWVTYANEAKVSQLGVSPDLIEAYGAVSSQVAEAMARGAREKAGADFGVAVTGIAGPDGGTDEKPVGLVYIAVAGDNDIVGECQCVIEKCVFSGSRGDIRLRTAMEALNILRGRLLGGL